MRSLMNVGDAARVLNISAWTVRRYITKGKLTVVRIGRRVLLEQEELERFIEAGKLKGHATQGAGLDDIPVE